MFRGKYRAIGRAGGLAAALICTSPAIASEFGVGQYGPDRDGARVSLWNTDQRLRADIRVASGESFIPAPNGRDYAVLRNGTAYIHRWDAALDYREERPLGAADALAFSSDAKSIAYAEDYVVRIQVPGAKPVEHRIEQPKVTHIGWGDHNTLLFLVADEPATVISLDPATGKSRAWLRTGRRQLLDIAPAPHDAYVVLMWDDPDAGIAYTMLDTETQTHSQLHTTAHDVHANVTWAPDGESLVLVDSAAQGENVLLHVDMDNLDSAHVLPPGETGMSPVYDPTGRYVAYTRESGLGVYDSRGRTHEIIVGSDARRRGGPFWVLWNPPPSAQLSSLPSRPALVRQQVALATPSAPSPTVEETMREMATPALPPSTAPVSAHEPSIPVPQLTAPESGTMSRVPDVAYAPPAPPIPPARDLPDISRTKSAVTPTTASTPTPRAKSPEAPALLETPLPAEPTARPKGRIALAGPGETFGASLPKPTPFPRSPAVDPLSQEVIVLSEELDSPEAALRAAIAGLRANDQAAIRSVTMTLGEEDGVFRMLASALNHNPEMASQLAERFASAAQEPIPWELSPDGSTAALPYARPKNRRPYYAFFSRTANGVWMWNLELSMMYENGPLPW